MKGHHGVVGAVLVVLGLALPGAATAATQCPSSVPSGFASAATLRALNAKEASFGAPRPTGGTAQRKFVDWLDRELRAVPGVQVKSIAYPIKRWDAERTALTVGGATIPVAGPVPYSHPTGAKGVTAPLAYIPAGTDITTDNSAGKIVVRDLGAGTVPYVVFSTGVLGVGGYDPTHLLTSGGNYTRDFLTPVQPQLDAAAAAGAKGIIFLRDLPRAQQKDFYAPYEGLIWKVPGAYLGADEAAQIRAAVAAGPASATLTVDATRTPVTTRTLVATIPGRSAQRLVVDSHTDGTNAVEDNGPVAMLAMVRQLAKRPAACRKRTLQFAFVTGHFYQHLLGPGPVRDGGSEQIAAQLDREYDAGKVGGVMVLEHLGAYAYDIAARPGGLPGHQLVRTTRHELALVGVTNSTPLRDATVAMVTREKLDPSAVIQGADVPVANRAPHFCSFGGEGSPYERHLLPTVATIAAPNVLFDPTFGLEAIDFSYMHRQVRGYADLLLTMSTMSQPALAGDIPQQRAARKAGTPTCPPN